MSLANTQVPVLKGSSKPRAAAPEMRNSQTRDSKFHRIVWAHCLGSELQSPHLVQGLGAKERQSLKLGSSNCSPSVILPLGGSSGSPPSPNTPVSLDPLPASSWPPLEQRGSALHVWSPSWTAHFETFPLWAPEGSDFRRNLRSGGPKSLEPSIFL